MKTNEKNLIKNKFKYKSKKEALSLYSINLKTEDIKIPLVNEIKKKSKTQEKISERKTFNKNEAEYKIGQYLIKKTIGKGSFGKVKLGIYLPNKEKVAIKILDKNRIKEKDDLVRIKREFEILSKFDHPNIILIAEIFETQERYYSVMEYCEGGELFNYIVKKRYLCEEEASFFFYQLISGLEYLHSLGIVHRDLKPENLLLTENNLLKIIDFGLSNYHNANSDSLLETPCGSPCYASPEMVSGLRYDGYKIDIWSCGIILFAMLCGYLPFEDKDNEKLFNKILKCKIKLPEYLSDEAKDMILKILVKDPNKRFSLEQIKRHPFYLKGKHIFNSNFEIEQINFTKNINNNDNSKTKNKSNEKNNSNNYELNEKEKNKKIKNEINNKKNDKILIEENFNSLNENNKNNNINIMTYQPILTDYEENDSKIKERKKEKMIPKKLNSNKKYNKKRIKSSGIKSKKNKSIKKVKDNFNIFELFNNTNKKINNLPNKKSHNISNTKKNLSSGNLIKKLNSFLNNKINYKSNIYEKAIMYTDTNSKNKDSSYNCLNRRITTNTNTLKNFKDNENFHKTRLLTDIGINNINIHQKIDNITKLSKKRINYLNKNIFSKQTNLIKNNLMSNFMDKYIQRISSKKSDNNSKKNKNNSRSKEVVIKLSKKSNEKSNKIKNNINSDISNTGFVEADFSSYILKTEPNQYLNKIGSNNLLLNEISKNINTNPARQKLNNPLNFNKRNNNIQILKQKSIPTLSDYSDNVNKKNSIKKNIKKEKKKSIINQLKLDKLNIYNFSKKHKRKKTKNNSLSKKNSFFTIRNTMINLNIHTPAVIISSYHKKGIKYIPTKKIKSISKFTDIVNHDSESIFLNKFNPTEINIKEKHKNLLFKEINSKTGYNFMNKKSKNKLEYEQFNIQCTTNKNIDIKSNFSNIKIGNLIRLNAFKVKDLLDKKKLGKKHSNIIKNKKIEKIRKSYINTEGDFNIEIKNNKKKY